MLVVKIFKPPIWFCKSFSEYQFTSYSIVQA